MISRLSGLVTQNPMLLVWIALGSFTAGALSGGGAAWKVQGWRLDAVQARYDGFVATTKAMGEAAQKSADETKAKDKQRQEQADAENKRTINSLHADIKRLRNERASGGGLSAPTPITSDPTRACFDAAQFSAALRRLDEGILGIVETGSEAVINLDTAKKWAQPK